MNKKLIWIFSGVVGLGLIVWMAYALAGEEPPDPSIAFRDVTVEGANLPQFVQDAPDTAVGTLAPKVSGTDWDGTPVIIEADGRPKLVMGLAHWCQFCQAEVPEIVDWVDGGGLPDDVDLYAVTIMSDHTRSKWPPQKWLEEEGWSNIPVLMDSRSIQAQLAYGASATPFYLILDGENRVIGRSTGRIGIAGLEAFIALARAGLTE